MVILMEQERLLTMDKEDNAVWVKIACDDNLLKYIIEKGSIAMDGISLTVAKVTACDFSVSIIPHTKDETTLLSKKIGDRVNLENDMVGKYIEHFMHFGDAPAKRKRSLDFQWIHSWRTDLCKKGTLWKE